MKKFLCTVMAVCLPLLSTTLKAQEKGDVTTELKQLIDKVQEKISDGKRTEKDFASELKQFDVLIAEHKGEKTDEAAQVPYMKATLYYQILDDTDKATAILKQIKSDFPGTRIAGAVDDILASYAEMEGAKKIQRALAPGTKFPDFDEKDIDGKPLSVARFKGKVVLVDFWATWCIPCRMELPDVIKVYQKYHDKGFEIIGVSLDQDKDALTAFLKENNMPWPEYFDGNGWQNKLSQKYGVSTIPASYLLDKDGKIIDKGLRGEALDKAVGKALGK